MKISLIFLMLFPILSFANNTGGGVYVGNGGNVIICQSSLPAPLGGEEILMSDFWMALVGAPMKPVEQEVQNFEGLETFDKAFSFFEQKLQRVPWFHSQLTETASKILIDDDSFIDGPLPATEDDFFMGRLPQHCKKQQIAIRRGNRVYIDRDLFARMSQEQRAILYMHEYIYALGAMNYGHNSSVRAQTLIVYLLQNNPTAEQLSVFLTDHFTVRP